MQNKVYLALWRPRHNEILGFPGPVLVSQDRSCSGFPRQVLFWFPKTGSLMSSSSDTTERLSEFDVLSEPDAEASPVRCLFDGFTSLSSAAVWLHMKTEHKFDLTEIRKQSGTEAEPFDDYARIKLVNFLRKCQLDGKTICLADVKRINWDCEEFLLATISDDPLLWSMPPDAVDWSDGEDDDDERVTRRRVCDVTTEEEAARLTDAQIASLTKEVESLKEMLSKVEIQQSHHEDAIENKVKPNSSRLPKCIDEDKHYFESYSSLSIHQEMILDSPRTAAYFNFIQSAKDYIKGKIVLDVGCGTGILSMFCAQAGAKLVVGVDAASDTLNTARKLVATNGFTEADIQLFDGKLEDLDIYFDDETQTSVNTCLRGGTTSQAKQKFTCDIIVSEWMGYALLYENMLCTVVDARDRFLVSGGLMIPSRACMQMWGVDWSQKLHEALDVWNDRMYGLDLKLLKPDEYKYLRSIEVTIVEQNYLRSKPETYLDLNLATIQKNELGNLRCQFKLKCKGPMTSLALSFFCLFELPSKSAAVVCLDTGPTSPPTHWRQTLCHIKTPDNHWFNCPAEAEVTLNGCITLSKGSRDNARHLTIIVELDHINIVDEEEANQPAAFINQFELR